VTSVRQIRESYDIDARKKMEGGAVQGLKKVQEVKFVNKSLHLADKIVCISADNISTNVGCLKLIKTI